MNVESVTLEKKYHDAVEHLAKTGTLAAVAASEPRDTISVAQAIAHIAAALTGGRHADVH